MEKIMSLQFISKTDMAETGPGKKATKPTVTVMKNGRIVLNSLSTEGLGKTVEQIYMAVDPTTRAVHLYAVTAELNKKLKAKGFEPNPIKLKINGKTGIRDFAATAYLKAKSFGEDLYNYNASGNQTFDADVSKPGLITFTLPKGNLTPKPTVTRTRKAKANGAANGAGVQAANAGSVGPNSLPVPDATGSEELLDSL